MNDKDRRLFEWVRTFNNYDLYTKSHERPDVATLKPFYLELIAEFFPERVKW
jgi:inositol oxygenase